MSTAAPSTVRTGTTKSKRNSKTPKAATPGTHITPSVTGKRKRDGTPVTIVEDEQDELEQEDVMEAITGRRSWGEQIPAPKRKQSLGGPAEIATGEDELEQADVAHDLSNASRMSLNLEQSIALLPVAEEEIPSSRDAEQPDTTATLPPIAKTPVSTHRTKPPKSRRKTTETTTTVHEDVEKENETHSTFIRRMYKPRQPLQSMDGPSVQRKAPFAPVFALSPNNIEPFLGEPSSIVVADETENLNLSIDPSLEDITTGFHAADNTRALSTTGIEAAQDTPLFTTPGESFGRLPNIEADISPVRGRKRRRTGSLKAGQDDDSIPKAPKVRSKKKAKRTVANDRPPTHQEPDSTAVSTGAEEEQATASQRPAATTVPITVYRLSKAPTFDDDDDELNDMSNPATSTRLPAVNPVDVLTQITTEVIEHMAETAHRLPTTTSARSSNSQATKRKPDSTELKRKRAILHHFKQSLSDSLFDITTALDAGSALSTRLKALTKEKIQLREELLAVRKQREDVALRIDKVRRDHIAWREKTTNRDELSADLWDLEMAVRSGKEVCDSRRARDDEVEKPSMGIEMLAAVLSGAVGGAGHGGGLCGKVERLNGMLEKAADVLEGRA